MQRVRDITRTTLAVGHIPQFRVAWRRENHAAIYRRKLKELCESQGGRPGLPVLNNRPCGLCGCTGTLEEEEERGRTEVGAQQLCGSRGSCPGLPVPNKPDGFCGRKAP